MPKKIKNHMSDQDKKDWDELYQYVKKILGYDEKQVLSKRMVLRLKGLLNNKFIANNNIDDTANYSYKTVLNTFKFCLPNIQKGFQNKSFNDETHKFNYILAIVESNLNDVYIRMKNSEKSKEKIEMIDVDIITHTGAKYQRKTKKCPDELNDLW